MAVTVAWKNETHAVIQINVCGKWTLEELYTGIQDAHILQDSVTHKVQILVDAQDARGLPKNLMPVVSYIARTRRSNTNSHIIVITQNPLILGVTNMLNQLPSNIEVRFKVVRTEIEAEALLAYPV